MSTMSMEQVENEMRAMVAQGSEAVGIEMQTWADAIDAQIKAHGEPVAWMHDTKGDAYVISNVVKKLWLNSKPSRVKHYTIPLYTTPPAPKIEVTDAMVERLWQFSGWSKTSCRAALEATLKETP